MNTKINGRLESIYKGGPLNIYISVSNTQASQAGIDFLNNPTTLVLDKENFRVQLPFNVVGTGTNYANEHAYYANDGTNQSVVFNRDGNWTKDDNNLPAGIYDVYFYLKTNNNDDALVIPAGKLNVLMPQYGTPLQV